MNKLILYKWYLWRVQNLFYYLYMFIHFLIIIFALPLCPPRKALPFQPHSLWQTTNPKSVSVHELVLHSSECSPFPSLVPSLEMPSALESPAWVSFTEPAAQATAALLCRPPVASALCCCPLRSSAPAPPFQTVARKKEHQQNDWSRTLRVWIALS